MAPVSSASASSSSQMTSCHIPLGPPGSAGCRFRMANRRHISALVMSM